MNLSSSGSAPTVSRYQARRRSESVLPRRMLRSVSPAWRGPWVSAQDVVGLEVGARGRSITWFIALLQWLWD